MKTYLKALLFLLSFLIFHFGYEVTHLSFLIPFCGINESVFQHLKMAFWGYLLLTAIEYIWQRQNIKEKIKNFWYSRALSAIMIPWFILIIWYLLPALYGRANSLALDLSWAIISTYLSGFFVIAIEKEMEQIKFRTSTKIIIWTLLIISAFSFIWFTYKLPWIDLFINPKLIS